MADERQAVIASTDPARGSWPLSLLFANLLGFALIIGCLLLALHFREARRAEGQDLRYLGEIVAQSTTATLKQYESLLSLLGQRLLEVGAHQRPEAGRELIQSMITVNDGMAGFGLARADGQLLLVSDVSPGTPLPNLLRQPASAASFRDALHHPGLRTGRTYFMSTLQRWVIPIRVALREPNSTGVRFVMTAGLNILGGDTAWNIHQMPDGVLVQIFRADGYLQFQNLVLDTPDYANLYNDAWPAGFLAQLWRLALRVNTDQQPTDWNLIWPDGSSRVVSVVSLADYDLLVAISRPMSQFYWRWLTSIVAPVAVLLVFLLMAILVYRHARQLQGTLQSQLIYQATHDPLTRLPNRTLLTDRLRQLMLISPQPQRLAAILFVDLDDFKRINNSYGHEAGDHLLQTIARRLIQRLPPQVTLGRQSGDEFIVLIPIVPQLRDIATIAEAILDHFRQSFQIHDNQLTLTASIGIAVYPLDAQEPITLLRNAGTALHNAKNQRRGGFLFYDQTMNQSAQRRLQIENELRQALEHRELWVVYQPQVEIASGRIIGCEALLRWHNDRLGTVSPEEFIPIAEDTGIITALGQYVLETACEDIATLIQRLNHSLVVAVNLSARQLLDIEIVETIHRCLQHHNLAATSLVVEVTESVFIHDFEQAWTVLKNLRDLGVGVSIDDFGTGYSSLSYLNRLPVSEIKIDRSFVDGICDDPTDANVVRSIIALGEALQLDVVAEGVETEAQMALLRQLSCRRAQGYHIARPLERTALEAFLAGP